MSSSVVLENVDDYLAPSQACINPLFQPPTNQEDEKKEEKEKPAIIVPRRRRRRQINVSVASSALPPKKLTSKPPSEAKSVVKASIVDCLACSGCVTTAETVLLEQRHSLDSLRKRLQSSDNGARVLTLSPNSWGDMCRHWQLVADDVATYRQFATLLNQILEVNMVVDGNLPLQWTWLDEAQEFVELFKMSQQQTGENNGPQPPSSAIDFAKTQYYQPDGTSKVVDNATDEQNIVTMPLISGSCPALVCLVEKSMSHLVPNLSQSQSPMSRLGTVLKEQGETIWDHWAIMPCHDKKLEASRQDFLHGKRNIVDLVITTSECVELVDEWLQSSAGTSETGLKSYLQKVAQAEQKTVLTPNELPTTVTSKVTLITTPTSKHLCNEDHAPSQAHQMAFSSGGHANFIFSYAAKELFGCSLDTVEWKAASLASSKSQKVKSARLAQAQKQHYYKAQLYLHSDGMYSQTSAGQAPVLDFSIAHGMQPMQRALKELSDETHYLEAMACPHGGCVNGGGAVKTTVGRETPTETRERVQQTLSSLVIPERILSGVSRPLRTRYHVVPPMQHTIGAAAGVKVDDIIW